MIYARYLLVPLALSLLFVLPPSNAMADDNRSGDTAEQHKWFLTLYGGPHAQPDLEHVALFDWSIEDDTYIGVAALAREFWRYREM